MITLCSFRSSTTWNWCVWAKINRFKLHSRFHPFSLYILHRNAGFCRKQVAISDFTTLRPCKPLLLPAHFCKLRYFYHSVTGVSLVIVGNPRGLQLPIGPHATWLTIFCQIGWRIQVKNGRKYGLKWIELKRGSESRPVGSGVDQRRKWIWKSTRGLWIWKLTKGESGSKRRP